MSEPRKVSKAEIEAGLKVLRRRRVIFWILIAVYLPMIYVVLEMSGSDKGDRHLLRILAVLCHYCRQRRGFFKMPELWSVLPHERHDSHVFSQLPALWSAHYRG